ncbi:hypothetical protein BS78_02G307900 [Paspalum vaginatum]|nr:hypothetical protein BS78_02G307900 [Paspalum vaginatum]
MAGANKALLCFCLLMLLAMSSGENDVSKAKKKCVPLWDNYCVKKQKCNDKCNGFQGSDGLSYTGGYCALWTCVCCRPASADEIAPAPLGPGHN